MDRYSVSIRIWNEFGISVERFVFLIKYIFPLKQTGPSQSRNELHIDTRSDSGRSGNSNMNGGRDRISPQYNNNGPNSSRPASTSTYDIKSDSPSRKRRRVVSTRQSPTSSSSWDNRQSPRSSQNHGHQHSPLLRRRLRDQQHRSWEHLPNIFQQTPSPPHQQQQHSRMYQCIESSSIASFNTFPHHRIQFEFRLFQKRHSNNRHSKINYWWKWIKCQLRCVMNHRLVGPIRPVHTYQIHRYKICHIHGCATIAFNHCAQIRLLLRQARRHNYSHAKCMQTCSHSHLLKIAITLASHRHHNWPKCNRNPINRHTIITCNRLVCWLHVPWVCQSEGGL